MNNFAEKSIKNYLHLIFLTFIVQIGFSQCPNIIWSDEFSGTSLDLSKWNYQIGDGCAESICGWGNNELQSYQEANVVVSNGTLKINAKKERIRGTQYTSGRINSKNKGDFTYGRFEASIKLPYGDGLWPAFWMLSTNEPYGSWPQSGEIDIMESVASNPNKVFGTIHYGDPYPNNQFQGNDYILKDANFPDAFHEFAIEWEPGEIRWFVDGILHSKKRIEDISPYNWPFDNDFYFLLNLAVGGNLGGPVNDAMLPATMEVDYVRVYDGFKPYFSGNSIVSNQEPGVVYSINNLASNVNVTWTVPSDATIVSGQGSSSITVNFGSSSGQVTASFNDGCSDKYFSSFIEVEPPYIKEFSFENFDDPATAVLSSSTGNLTEVANPAPSIINNSAVSGEYVRNSTEQYDLITYNVSNITDASKYVDKSKKFYMDVYTSAPVGTQIILQLETPVATASNYPSGRHSRYVATVKQNNSWERLAFTLLDRPDTAALDTDVTKLILLFASNTFTGDTYYFDNFDSYAADTGTPSNQLPTVSITNPSDGATFDANSIANISATAADTDGTISQVEFFANGTSIGVDTLEPFAVDFTVPLGQSILTAVATDNSGGTTTSSQVTITGQSASSALSLHISSIIIGSSSAGKGQKYGTASVTIEDDLGNLVSNANVTGTFSGTFNEQVTAVTNVSGVATLQTSTASKGTLTLDICIDAVTHNTLVYDATSNAITCTGGTAKIASKQKITAIEEDSKVQFKIYPNPVSLELFLDIQGFTDKATVTIYSVNGVKLLHREVRSQNDHINVSNLQNGLYILRVHGDVNQDQITKFLKL